jgi:DNA-binding FrmR family transcriptional regulator
MRNIIVAQHLKRASNNVTDMISMISENSDCIDVLRKSKEVQREIEIARKLLLESYMKRCATDLIRNNKQEKLEEIVKLFRYR